MSVKYTTPARRLVARVGADSNNWRTGTPLNSTVSSTSNIQPILRCSDGTRIPLQQCGTFEFQVDEAYHIELTAASAAGIEDAAVTASVEDAGSSDPSEQYESANGSLTAVEANVTDDTASEVTVANCDLPNIVRTEPALTPSPGPATNPVNEEPLKKRAELAIMPRHAPHPHQHASLQHAPSYMYTINYSDTEPDMSKKEYCAYWIRKGECDYTQQGCRFKHEMPDLATLRRIGFREYPAWWRMAPRSVKLRMLRSWTGQGESDEDGAVEGIKVKGMALEGREGALRGTGLAESFGSIPGLRIRSNSISSQETDLLVDFRPLKPEFVDTPARSTITSMDRSPVPPNLSSPTTTPTIAKPSPASSPEVQYLFRNPKSPTQVSAVPVFDSSLTTTNSLPNIKKSPSTLNTSPVISTPQPSPASSKESKTLANSKWAGLQAQTHPATTFATVAGISVPKGTPASSASNKPAVPSPASSPVRRHKQGLMRAGGRPGAGKVGDGAIKVRKGSDKGKKGISMAVEGPVVRVGVAEEAK